MRGLLIAVASRRRAQAPGARASVVVARGLGSCGARAWLLRAMWDLPGPGLEPVSPALAGRFLTTVPPGKPKYFFLKYSKYRFNSQTNVCTLKSVQIRI